MDHPPKLSRVIELPEAFCTTESAENRTVSFGGDIRIGELRNSGQADFLIYRSVDDAHDEEEGSVFLIVQFSDCRFRPR